MSHFSVASKRTISNCSRRSHRHKTASTAAASNKGENATYRLKARKSRVIFRGRSTVMCCYTTPADILSATNNTTNNNNPRDAPDTVEYMEDLQQGIMEEKATIKVNF